MIYKHFSVGLLVRLGFLFLTMVVLAGLVIRGGYEAASLIVAIVLILQIWSLLNYVNRTNRELHKFLDSIRYSDFTQKFSLDDFGTSFGDLGAAFNAVLDRFRETRAEREEQARYLKVLVEHVPVAVIVIYDTGQVELLNNAARRLFGAAHIGSTAELDQYGRHVRSDLLSIGPGERRLTRLNIDGTQHQVTISATEIRLKGERHRLISLQSIQSELDVTEVEAWQTLVRVLTHEIMNSLTPVASLSTTAQGILEDARALDKTDPLYDDALDDVGAAIATVARRSDNLMDFVQNYRKITKVPPPKRQNLALEQLFDGLARLMRAQWGEQPVTLEVAVAPHSLEVSADPELLEQALINLLKNAGEAVEESEQGLIRLSAHLDRDGHVRVEVRDNGPGIRDSEIDDIFVPFYTSKRDGSGIGLSLVRQIMIGHGGQATVQEAPGGGALFRLIF